MASRPIRQPDTNNMAEGPLKDLLIDGIIGGVGGVIVFRRISSYYFFISILEDSGYMARAAFIMDKIMHRMGLHGKSFIPLIMDSVVMYRYNGNTYYRRSKVQIQSPCW